MRIVNTGYSPRYLSYGDAITGGKTLEPGKESKDLPLSYVHSQNLWKDIDKGVCQIRLSDNDKAFLKKVLEAGEKPITLMQPPKPPAPQARPKPPPPKPQLTPVLNDPVPVVPPTPGQEAVFKLMEGVKPDEFKKPGEMSLQDLMQANKGLGAPVFKNERKATLAEIQTHMKGRT